jgi:hypothetical protein
MTEKAETLEEPYWLTQSDFNAVQRKSMAKQGLALPDGSFPIVSKTDLKNAIQAIGRAKNRDKAKKHIIRRAKALGALKMLPDSWGVSQEFAEIMDSISAETPQTLIQYLVLDSKGALPKPVVLEEATAENNGRMRIKVPFYVGDSISKAPGFNEKLYFPRTQLAPLVSETNRKIGEAKQPLTVYARHAHAMTADLLPIGAVVETLVGEDGRTGYAIMDILPTDPHGKNAQMLIDAGMLNAVSLRSEYGNYQVEKKKINGEAMLEATITTINGIDFAPDGPAMPTYGVEVLAAEASVEPYVEEPETETPPVAETPPVVDPPVALDEQVTDDKTDPKSNRRQTMSESEIKLEDVKARPDLVERIVAPVKAELAEAKEEVTKVTAAKVEAEKKIVSLTAEVEALKAAKSETETKVVTLTTERDDLYAKETLRLRDEKIREIAREFPDPEKALPILTEGCKDAKTAEDVTKFAYPIMLELFKAKDKAEQEKPKPTTLEQLRAMFIVPEGKGIVAENKTEGPAIVSAEEKAYRATYGGLMTPDF